MKCISFQCDDAGDNTETSHEEQVLQEDHTTVRGLSNLPKKDEWCLVVYEDRTYVGKVTQTDEENDECEVSAVKQSQSEVNKFIFPTRADKIWYKRNDFMMIINEPQYITKRVLQLDAIAWKAFCEQ